MLAPLKDRSILEKAPDELPARIGALPECELVETRRLAKALRQARSLLKRSATISTQQIVALTNQNSVLAEQNQQLRSRLAELESGQSIVALGQALLAARQEIDQLRETARQAWFLDRSLCAAHGECERLARERDAAIQSLMAHRLLE